MLATKKGNDILRKVKIWLVTITLGALSLTACQPEEEEKKVSSAQNSNQAGKKTQNFIRLNMSGQPLEAQDGTFDLDMDRQETPQANEGQLWACIKDTRTKLIWEVKTQAGSPNQAEDPDNGGDASGDDNPGDMDYQQRKLRNLDLSLSWYQTSNNGGVAGSQSGDASCGVLGVTNCNTSTYLAALQGLCGRTNWRLPSESELKQLIFYTKEANTPLINKDNFPVLAFDVYWTGDTDKVDPALARVVSFNQGRAAKSMKSSFNKVLAVSSY